MRNVLHIIIETDNTSESTDEKGIRSKPTTRLFDVGWERTFGQKQAPQPTSNKDLN